MDYKRMNDFRMLGLTIAYYRKLRGRSDTAEPYSYQQYRSA